MPSAKPFLHPLKTPKSATFPSELHEDTLSSTSDTVKHEDGISTPITPPTAYTDFLKAFTPVFASPVSAGVNFPKFPVDKPATNKNSPTSQPASAVSGSFVFNEPVKSATTSLPPPTPGAAPSSRKDPGSLRRLRIPPMHFSPTSIESPRSARSATTVCSPFSPSDWKLRYYEPPRTASGKPVSVRQVVTRTVTYKRMQLDAPPKGKRRKYHESKDSEKSS